MKKKQPLLKRIRNGEFDRENTKTVRTETVKCTFNKVEY